MPNIAWAFIRSRINQSSTWAGIVTFSVGMLGITLSPEYTNAISAVALAISSLVCVVIDQRSGKRVPVDSAPPVVPTVAAPATRSADPVRDRFGTGRNV